MNFLEISFAISNFISCSALTHMGLDVGIGYKALVHLLECGSCGRHENPSHMHMVTGLTQSEKVDNLGRRNVFKIDRSRGMSY